MIGHRFFNFVLDVLNFFGIVIVDLVEGTNQLRWGAFQYLADVDVNKDLHCFDMVF